jgi:hypothetical protein
MGGITGFFESLFGASASAASGWLASAAGQIGQGIEAGFMSFFTDTWDVIVGPLEVGLGGFIMLLGLVLAFKDDMFGIAALAAIAK